jgi:hypothetical protein
VRIFWEDDQVWYLGVVKDYNTCTELHMVQFDDGDQREEPLNFPTAATWELERAETQGVGSSGRSSGGGGSSGRGGGSSGRGGGGNEGSQRAKAPPAAKAPAVEGVFTVSELLAQRTRNGKTQYLVSWLGYGPADNTWEYERNILDEGLVLAFKRRAAGEAKRKAADGSGQGGGEAKRRASEGKARAPAGAPTGGPKRSTTSLPANIKQPSLPSTPGKPGKVRRWNNGGKPPASPRSPALSKVSPRPGGGDAWLDLADEEDEFNGQIYVGPAHQAELPPRFEPSVRAPPAPPPQCRCGRAAAWQRGRWWCGGGHGTDRPFCGYETEVPPAERTPLCGCGQRAAWLVRRWWCATRHEETGCGFEMKERVTSSGMLRTEAAWYELQQARATAAMLTAAPLGMDALTFVAPSGRGLGLFARATLLPGMVVGEFGGPRLPLRDLRRREFTLPLPGYGFFVDGNWDHARELYAGAAVAAAAAPRYLAIHVRPSKQPNCRFEKCDVGPSPGPLDLRHRMMLVTSEGVPAGGELRVDFEKLSATAAPTSLRNSVRAEAAPADERVWRAVRLPTPPPADPDSNQFAVEVCDAQGKPFLPVAPPTAARAWADTGDGAVEADAYGGAAHDGSSPWSCLESAAAATADARLRQLYPLLYRENPTNWSVIASHLPGSTGGECKRRWHALTPPDAPAAAPEAAKAGGASKASGASSKAGGASAKAATASGRVAVPRQPWSPAASPPAASPRGRTPIGGMGVGLTPLEHQAIVAANAAAAAAAAAPPMSAAEVLAAAEAEGLVLVPKSGGSEYRGVFVQEKRATAANTRWRVEIHATGASSRGLGRNFGTAIEAALHFARMVGPKACALMVAGSSVSMLDAVVRTRFGDVAADAERGVDAEKEAEEAEEEEAEEAEAAAAAGAAAAAEIEAAAEVGAAVEAGAAAAAKANGSQDQRAPSSTEPAKKQQKTAAAVDVLTPRYGLCGTPNCFLKDFHQGPCEGQHPLGRRRSSLATPHPTK